LDEVGYGEEKRGESVIRERVKRERARGRKK
jgi:hypothetical protein